MNILIDVLINVKIGVKHSLICWIPERFMYYELVDAQWFKSAESHAELIIDSIIKKSYKMIEKEKEEGLDELHNYLSLWNLSSLDEYEKVSPEIKEEIDLPHFYENYGFTDDGLYFRDFEDYDILKNQFLNEIFDLSKVKFFSNIREGDEFDSVNKPAIIGIDNAVIGIFWYMND